MRGETDEEDRLAARREIAYNIHPLQSPGGVRVLRSSETLGSEEQRE